MWLLAGGSRLSSERVTRREGGADEHSVLSSFALENDYKRVGLGDPAGRPYKCGCQPTFSPLTHVSGVATRRMTPKGVPLRTGTMCFAKAPVAQPKAGKLCAGCFRGSTADSSPGGTLPGKAPGQCRGVSSVAAGCRTPKGVPLRTGTMCSAKAPAAQGTNNLPLKPFFTSRASSLLSMPGAMRKSNQVDFCKSNNPIEFWA